MRLGSAVTFILAGAMASGLAGCSGAPADPATAPAAGASGDATLIAAAQKISDTLGGCVRPADATTESRVVGLDGASVVMLACSQGAYSYTHRLFAVNAGETPHLISLPDYDTTGWFGSDQASMAELDAGSGVLTTTRKSSGSGTCGSEGRYQWDKATERFALQEMRWQDCGGPDQSGAPFPTIWPAPIGSTVQPGDATPAP